MATFLPNVTDVFAGVSDFDPDFNRIERMLKIRENAYQQGAKKIKSLYDSVFNSQMLRDQNIKTRDAYLKTISETLNALSSTDLSLPQNQQTATDLFNPILTDNNLQKDIVYTRNYYDELGKAEKLRTSKDDATRKRYWTEGIKALQYQAEDFRNADAQTALGMSSPKYVQQIDIQTLADKMYKDAGISVKQDNVNGGYIFTKKNGDLALPISKSYVESMFSSDPGIVDMMRTRAYVTRKDFIQQNAAALGGKEKAEQVYLERIIKTGMQTSQQDITENETEVAKLRDRVESWNKKITKDGIVPGSDDHKKYLADLDKLKMAEQGLKSKKDQIASPQTIDFNNIEELRQQADGLVAMSNYTILADQVANRLAYKNAEFTLKADPISLAHLHADLSLRNQKIMEKIRFDNDLIKLQMEIDAGKYDHSSSTKKGTVTPNTPDGTELKLTQEQMDALIKGRSGDVIPDQNAQKENENLSGENQNKDKTEIPEPVKAPGQSTSEDENLPGDTQPSEEDNGEVTPGAGAVGL